VLGLVDLSRLGVFGHSFGGAAAVWAASETPLLRASANMDGRLWGDVLGRGSTKPVLIFRSEGASAEADASIAEFTSHALAPVHRAQVSGALHNDFSDSALLVQALAQLDPRVQPAQYQVGAIGPGRILAIECAYLRALFEAAWSGEASALLAGPAPEFPEVSLSTRWP
jgi:dienelactone hydrolase